jgi:hypothetical protein
MSHDSRNEAASTAMTMASAIADIGGRHALYANPQALISGVVEFLRNVRYGAHALATLPPGATGGFLRAPEGSHFGK